MTALSGFHFVHHQFNSSLTVIKGLSQPVEQKVLDAQLTGTVVSSSLSVLEQQFLAFKTCADLEFAIQQEANDWNENLITERFFVLTGLSAAPPPSCLVVSSHPRCFLSETKFIVSVFLPFS